MNRSLNFVLGPKSLITTQKRQIPNIFQDVRFKQTSADSDINTPSFTNLRNSTCCSPDTHLDWTLTLIPEETGTLDPFLIYTPPPNNDKTHSPFLSKSPRYSVCYSLSLTLFNKLFFPFFWLLAFFVVVFMFDFYPAQSQGPS